MKDPKRDHNFDNDSCTSISKGLVALWSLLHGVWVIFMGIGEDVLVQTCAEVQAGFAEAKGHMDVVVSQLGESPGCRETFRASA